ncbi:MAG: iron-containing alcohol dehydrogenase, partial [Lentisphaeria bacterium]
MLPTISYLTDIYFGPGVISELCNLCEAHNVTRPLLVTDQGLVALGMHERVPCEPAAMFADIPTNPTEQSVLAGLDAYHENDCDGIIALGGGSPIDCAKAISLLVTHPKPLEQYALIRGGLSLITADKPPLFAVPTTAGTGSEVGRASLITVASGTKLGLISKHLIPTAAVCDPELTLGMPAQLTAATGIDAISHCVETFCSPKLN